MATPDRTATPATSPAGPDASPGDNGPVDKGLIGRLTATVKALLDRVDRYQRSHRPTAVAFAVVKKFGDDQAGNLAALVAYYTFFSIFPLLLVMVTLVGFVLDGNTEAQTRILDSALSQFPVIGDELRTNIGSFRGSGPALAIGLLGALWGGMGAVEAMQNAMNSVWNVPIRERPNLLQSRLRSMAMLVILGLAIGASTAVTSGATSVEAVPVVGRLVIEIVAVALNVGLFLCAYKVLTNIDVGWKAMGPGAVVAGVAFSVLQAVGGWYIARVLRGATQTYGTFAVVLGLLSWLYLLAQVSVLAAEVNVVLYRNLVPRSLTGEDLSAADESALRHYAEVEERVPGAV